MLILASQSPRRQELLTRITPDFSVCPATIDERALPLLPPPAYVQSLAQAKAAAVAKTHPEAIVVAADTMVVWQGQLLGKPADRVAAATMLQELSGQTHQVLTGLAVFFPDGRRQATVVTTAVTFWPLSQAAINAYLATGEYQDKAGAYGIQGQGALLVRALQGDYYNVVGLPISTLARLLAAEPI
ncbi:MAG: Maf family protein [Lactobacillus sp.]|nr:Maf family protein [Lactobacillus sp.]MCI2034195.1 Maf family protein [Lactobacillus sp.]